MPARTLVTGTGRTLKELHDRPVRFPQLLIGKTCQYIVLLRIFVGQQKSFHSNFALFLYKPKQMQDILLFCMAH